jgi:hypothetical protein
VFDGLKLADLGWDRNVSTVAFKGGLRGYYDEKAQPARANAPDGAAAK